MSINEFVDQGGVIAYFLLFMSIVGFTTILYKFVQFIHFSKKASNSAPEGIIKNLENLKIDKHVITDTVYSEVDLLFTPLEKGLIVISTIATMAPLIGLLGTVLGIFQAFSVIADHGLENSVAFAAGIKVALITTVIGLIVAIPHAVAFNLLQDQLDHLRNRTANRVLIYLGRNLSRTCPSKKCATNDGVQ